MIRADFFKAIFKNKIPNAAISLLFCERGEDRQSK